MYNNKTYRLAYTRVQRANYDLSPLEMMINLRDPWIFTYRRFSQIPRRIFFATLDRSCENDAACIFIWLM